MVLSSSFEEMGFGQNGRRRANGVIAKSQTRKEINSQAHDAKLLNRLEYEKPIFFRIAGG